MQHTSKKRHILTVSLCILSVLTGYLLSIAVGSFNKPQPFSSDVPKAVTEYNELVQVDDEMMLEGRVIAHKGIHIKEGGRLILAPGCNLTLNASNGLIWCDGKISANGSKQSPVKISKCGGIIGGGEIELRHADLVFVGVPSYTTPPIPQQENTNLELGLASPDPRFKYRSPYPYMIMSEVAVIEHSSISISGYWKKRIVEAGNLSMKDSSVRYHRMNIVEDEGASEYRDWVNSPWVDGKDFKEPYPAIFAQKGEISGCRFEGVNGCFASGNLLIEDCELQNIDSLSALLSYSSDVKFRQCVLLDSTIKVAVETFEESVFKRCRISAYSDIFYIDQLSGGVRDSFLFDCYLAPMGEGIIPFKARVRNGTLLRIRKTERNGQEIGGKKSEYVFDGCFLFQCRCYEGGAMNLNDSIVEACSGARASGGIVPPPKYPQLRGVFLLKISNFAGNRAYMVPYEAYFSSDYEMHKKSEEEITEEHRETAVRKQKEILVRIKRNIQGIVPLRAKMQFYEYADKISEIANIDDNFFVPLETIEECLEGLEGDF